MKTLAQYLADYLNQEIIDYERQEYENPKDEYFSATLLQEWIEQGIEAYESTENCTITMQIKSYDVQDVIDAEITLEPMKCRHCGFVGETTYYDQQGDAYCAACGKWQLQDG